MNPSARRDNINESDLTCNKLEEGVMLRCDNKGGGVVLKTKKELIEEEVKIVTEKRWTRGVI